MSESFSTGHANMICAAFKAAYANCVIGIYSGTKPASADLAENGALLALITLNGGNFTAGQPTNGLNFGTVAAGSVPKAPAETWSGLGKAAAGAGTNAGYFRMYANAYVTGASSTAVRYDGDCSTDTSGEMQLASLSIVQNASVLINNFTYTPPKV